MSNRNPDQPGDNRERRELIEVLHDDRRGGVVAVDGRRRIIACNAEAESLLRVKARRLLGCSCEQLPAPLPEIIREALSAGSPAQKLAVTLRSGRRGATRLQALVTLLRGAKGGKGGVVVVLTDPKPSPRLEANLRRLNRLASLGTLSAGMAHEVKNALVSVKTFMDLLLEKNRDAELAEVVGREMRRIEAIVGQMLKYAGPARPAFAPVRVHDVLDHSLRMVQPQLEGRLISLHRAFNAAPDAIKGDDYQLEQAFVNLLLNAIEAMGPNGSLTVATDLIAESPARPRAVNTSGAHVRIAIADTGVGISPENRARLFEPFFTTKQQGTGLGLAIARRIVEEHQGNIHVHSEVNKGTTFNILLPLHAK